VVVEPDYAPHTVNTYEIHSRLYVVPGLGSIVLDKLSMRQVRAWLNEIRQACQCCAQGKDARRTPEKRRCCAIGSCCQQTISERTAQDILVVLRAGLSNAVREELIPPECRRTGPGLQARQDAEGQALDRGRGPVLPGERQGGR
jgi:hypothetical protein